MKRLIIPVVALVLTATTAQAQSPSDVYTRPAVPPREVLDRLNLQLGWRAYVPVEGKRDGLFSVQLDGAQMFAQTRSGLVTALDQETGVTQWRARVGSPYPSQMQLGFNAVSVFVTRSNTLYSLDRNTGLQQWQIELPTVPSTTPTADEEYLYVAFASGRLYEFALPRYRSNPKLDAKKARKTEVLPPPGSAAKPGEAAAAPSQAPSAPGPVLLWDFATQAQLDVPPIISPGIVVMVSSTGSFFALSTQFDKHEIIPFHFQANVAQPFARHGDVAYVATKDAELYSLDLLTSRSLWRLALGGKILQQPLITDDDVYVVTQGNGLDRVERVSGLERWRKPNALVERCLAVNAKFVYGLDRYGKLLVLDLQRGTLLSSYDVRDFVVPIPNERTDRLFLAAHDGLIVALRDKEYTAPLRNKKLEETPTAPRKPLTKPAEKPKEEGTDTPKENDKEKSKDKGDADKDKPKEKGEDKKP